METTGKVIINRHRQEDVTKLYIIVDDLDTENQKPYIILTSAANENIKLENPPYDKYKLFIYGVDENQEIKISSVLENSGNSSLQEVHLQKHNSANSFRLFTVPEEKFSISPLEELQWDEYQEPTLNGQSVTLKIQSTTNGDNIYHNLSSVYHTFLRTESFLGSETLFKEYIITSKFPSFEKQLPSREKVTIKIYHLGHRNKHIGQSALKSFITRNTIADTEDLMRLAEQYISDTLQDITFKTRPTIYLYRNKPSKHPTIINGLDNGVFKKYLKDDNGDQASSINGKIDGLFFSASPYLYTGLPEPFSCFGDFRIMIELKYFLNETNLYFADFYCCKKEHYVVLVATIPGSNSDKYCHQRLPQLKWTFNKFLYFDRKMNQFRTTAARLRVWVYYTEDINYYTMINNRMIQAHITCVVGKGQSFPGYIKKNISCSLCNLKKIPKP